MNNNYNIQKRFISVEDGLPSRVVLCTVKDKSGFMWFGTENGLCRYDGKSIKVYTKQKDGLYGNIIERLVVDDSNRLFILYRPNIISSVITDKLQVFDLNKYTLKSLSNAIPNLPVPSKNIEVIDNAGNGDLYFISSAPYQIWQFNLTKGFRLRGILNLWENQKLFSGRLFYADFYYNSVFQNGNGVLNLRWSSVCYYVNADTLFSFSSLKLPVVFLAVDKKHTLEAFHQSQSTTDMNSFFCKDLKQTENTTNGNKMLLINSLTKNKNIHCVTNTGIPNQSYIIHVVNKSVYLFQDHQLILLIDKEEMKDYPDYAVNGYYTDNIGNIWLTTSLGVFKIKLKKNLFHQIDIESQPLGKIGRQVRGIYVEEDLKKKNEPHYQELLASFWYSLLYQNKYINQSFTTKNDLLYAILKHQDKIYIGGNNLYIYNAQNNKLQLENSINAGEIWSMYALNDSIILLGCTNQIFSYNTRTHHVDGIKYQTNGYPQPLNVYRFLLTKKTGLTAVAENGLYAMNSSGNIIDYYGKAAAEKSHQMPDYCIWDMYEDQQGICWLATNGDGLIRWEWNSAHPNEPKHFRKFDLEYGLPSNILYRIEEDRQYNLWISSYYGLIRFNKNNFTTHAYFTKDGLSNNEFNRSSSFVSASGKMYFGGMKGINMFSPNEVSDALKIFNYPFQLIGVEKYSLSKNSYLDCLPKFSSQQKITLEPSDKYLSINFVLLDYIERPHHYAYQIEGLSKQWNFINESNLQISGLPYGSYKMVIKAQLESGEWNENTIEMPINVLAPFYLKTSFLLFCLLAILIAVFFFIRFRSYKLSKDNKRLEQKVKERTQKISLVLDEKEVLLSEKNLLLTEIHHRVKNNLQVTNGLLQLRKGAFKDKKYVAAFNEGQSSIISIGVIHELLYQNEKFGSLKFIDLAKNIVSGIAQLFADTKRQIDFEYGNSSVVLNVDSGVPLGLILNELITNAYKYLPSGVDNKVKIDMIDLKDGNFQFIFQDNGPGLPPVIELNNINSIGLSIVKRLVAQLEGIMYYEFEKGAKFVITFPDLNVVDGLG